MSRPSAPRRRRGQRQTLPAVTYPHGYFTELMRHPSTGEIVWPPGFRPTADARSTAQHAANGTALREANKGHAKHGAKPDGARDDSRPRRKAAE